MAILNSIAQFGSYRLRTHLATGRACEVWLADVDKGVSGSPPVIVKRLRRELAQNQDILERFERRARATLGLSHENLNATIDVVRLEGDVALCQRYLDGKTLRELLSAVASVGNSLPVWFAVHVARCICHALDYAHTRTTNLGVTCPIIHYALCAQNVFLTYDGSVKVCDFGTNCQALQRACDEPPVASSRTQQGGPESLRLREGQSQVREDLEGLGEILYELLTGISPKSDSVSSLDFVPPSHHAPWVNAEVDQVLRRILSRSYPNRVHTAAELGRILDDYSSELCHNVTGSHLAGLITVLFSHESHDSSPPTRRFDEGANRMAQMRSRRTSPPEGHLQTGFEHSAPTRPGLMMPTSGQLTRPTAPASTETPSPVSEPPRPRPSSIQSRFDEATPQATEAKANPFHHDWDLALKHAREQSLSEGQSSETSKAKASVPPPVPPPVEPANEAVAAFEKGLECRQRGDLEGAMNAWERALLLDPNHRVCKANLSLIKKKLNRS